MIVYWLVRVCGFIWQKLPLRIGYSLASAVGDLTFLWWRYFWREKYQCLQDNMQHVLGQGANRAEVSRLARQSLRNYCKYMADFFRFPALEPAEIERMVVFSGWEKIDAALARGRGVIFIGLHMGNWDVGGAALALRRYPLNVITESFKPAKLDDLVQGTRRRLGMKILPMERSARRLFRVLQENEILCLLIDRPATEGGVVVDFFGHPVSVPGGAAALALRTGARVVPAGMIRLPDNTYLALVDDGIDYRPAGQYQDDMRALTQRIMASLEAMVRKYPDQWYMFRRMWNNPAG